MAHTHPHAPTSIHGAHTGLILLSSFNCNKTQMRHKQQHSFASSMTDSHETPEQPMLPEELLTNPCHPEQQTLHCLLPQEQACAQTAMPLG
jgi:hypothetical protein